VLLARAEIRKEPARTVSFKLIPGMQDRLEEWVEQHVHPESLLKINTAEANTVEINAVMDRIQAQLKRTGSHS